MSREIKVETVAFDDGDQAHPAGQRHYKTLGVTFTGQNIVTATLTLDASALASFDPPLPSATIPVIEVLIVHYEGYTPSASANEAGFYYTLKVEPGITFNGTNPMPH